MSLPLGGQSVNKYEKEGGFYLNESEYQMRTVLNNI